LASLLLGALTLWQVLGSPAEAQPTTCRLATITGYWRLAPYFNPHTFDGTPITTPEDIVAASWDVPLGARVTIEHPLTEGRTFRVADRGRLSPTHIDVAVWTLDEAYALTSTSRVCWS
jgi:hypothetical protein